MRIHLDTKDLIDLLEGRSQVELTDFDGLLRSGGHALVVSFTAVLEVAAPLVRAERSKVMQILNRLESLPGACQ